MVEVVGKERHVEDGEMFDEDGGDVKVPSDGIVFKDIPEDRLFKLIPLILRL